MKKISNSEFVIMDILWNSDQSLNRHQIFDLVHNNSENESWELATVSTYISRLCNKGIITYEKKNKLYCYYPLVSKLEYIQTMITQKVQEDFKMSFDELVLTYIGQKNTSKNIKQIHKYINEFKPE